MVNVEYLAKLGLLAAVTWK